MHDIDDENNDKDNYTEVEWVMITWCEEASIFHESVAQPCFHYVFSTSFFVSPANLCQSKVFGKLSVAESSLRIFRFSFQPLR